MVGWARETPWRQGHLLTDEAVDKLKLSSSKVKDHPLVIVATHDCDLVQSPEKEPSVELVVGLQIANLDGNSTHGKSSRTLHLVFEGDEPIMAEFVITDKCSVPKDDLSLFLPENRFRLSPANLRTFQRWLASRYLRSAFPDEFERRLVNETKLAESIRKVLKSQSEWITAVFFDVDEGLHITHVGIDDVYLLDIILLYAIEPDYEKAEAAAKATKEEIENAFKRKLFDESSGKWKWIELRNVDAVSEEALSYRAFTLLNRWRLDYISLGIEPQQPILSEQ
jgi:hypothetical protein